MKVRTNILIEESVLRTAQELGINVSKYCENALKIGIEALKNTQNQIQQQNKTQNSFSLSEGSLLPKEKVLECGRRDLNPGSQAWKACVLTRLDDDRSAFSIAYL